MLSSTSLNILLSCYLSFVLSLTPERKRTFFFFPPAWDLLISEIFWSFIKYTTLETGPVLTCSLPSIRWKSIAFGNSHLSISKLCYLFSASIASLSYCVFFLCQITGEKKKTKSNLPARETPLLQHSLGPSFLCDGIYHNLFLADQHFPFTAGKDLYRSDLSYGASHPYLMLNSCSAKGLFSFLEALFAMNILFLWYVLSA